MARDRTSTLDDLGILHGTDKSSLANNYLGYYEEIFAPFRDLAITLWEVGVAQGASLKLWSEYFPKAQIVGIDNNARCKQHEGPRIRVAIGSQDDPEFLAGLFRDSIPDIIIDDGSHRADHIQFTFGRLFPVLSGGGLYIIEDLWLHGGDGAARMRGRAAMAISEFTGSLTSRLMVGRIETEDDGGLPGYLFRTIDRIQVISGAVVIHKKKPAPERPLWESALPVIEKSKHPDNWYHLSSYIMQNRGPIEAAVEAMRKAVAQDPANPAYRVRLADCLDRSGALEEAISQAEEATQLAGSGTPVYLNFLDMLLRKREGQRPPPDTTASAPSV